MAQESIDEPMAVLRELYSRTDGPRAILEFLSQRILEEEASEHIGAAWHERTNGRRGYRNGHKPRSLHGRLGTMQLQVPQVRDCDAYQPTLWNRWQRHERALLCACAEMYFQGVSTRGVQEVLEKMCGGEISAMSVSRAAAELDEKLKTFRGRSLKEQSYPYLQIDARYEHVRIEGKVVSQAVLVVFGINGQGYREVLDWRVADSENEATWGALFRDLKDRGLQGVLLVISDAHRGIRAGLKRYFQGVCWQRCQVHFKRELLKKVGSKWFGTVSQNLSTLFKGDTKQMCLRCRDEMVEKWGKRYPAVREMLEQVEDCLTVVPLPPEHRRRLASTNHAERLMRELKRRTAVVSVFPNIASCDRLIGAQLMEEHEKWTGLKRPGFNMADLGAIERALKSEAEVSLAYERPPEEDGLRPAERILTSGRGRSPALA
jgi:putative transposase